MKKICYYLFCILMFCSCNNGKKKAEITRQRAYYDSVAEVIKIQEIEKKKVKDSLSEFAWGDAKFGISIKEALKTKAFKGFEKYNPDCISKTNGIDDLFYKIQAFFYQDKLYRVTISSYSFKSDKYYDKGQEISEKYKSLIFEKYGAPDYSYSMPRPFSFSEGDCNSLYKWIISNKHITIMICREISYSSNTYYHITCDILSQKDWELKQQEQSTKKKEIEQKEKEQSLF